MRSIGDILRKLMVDIERNHIRNAHKSTQTGVSGLGGITYRQKEKGACGGK